MHPLIVAPPVAATAIAGISARFVTSVFRRKPAIKSQLTRDGIEWLKENSKRYSLKSRDGLILAGYYIRGASNEKIAVIVHGYHSVAGDVVEYAKLYLRNGYSVFMPENRACGASEGSYVGMGWPDRLDIIDWMIWLEKKFQIQEAVLHGISMGASAIILASAEEELPRFVKCAISDCAYTSAVDELVYQVRKNYHISPSIFLVTTNFLLKAVSGYGFANADAVDAATKSSLPIFFIHGGKDEFTPPYMARKLYDAKHRKKALWIAPNTGHAQTLSIWPTEYEKRVISFTGRFIS